MRRLTAPRREFRFGLMALMLVLVGSVVAVPGAVRAQETAYRSYFLHGTCEKPTSMEVFFYSPNPIPMSNGVGFDIYGLGDSWGNVVTTVTSQPTIAVVYKNKAVTESTSADWVLCGAVDKANGNDDGINIALAEYNDSGMAGVIYLNEETDLVDGASMDLRIMESATAHWSPTADSQVDHRFTGSRGTCNAPSTEWWTFEPLSHLGPVATSVTNLRETSIENFNGGPHFFAVYDKDGDGATMIACGNAVGQEINRAGLRTHIQFPLFESNNSGYVGVVVVYQKLESAARFPWDDDEYSVRIDVFLFPGAPV